MTEVDVDPATNLPRLPDGQRWDFHEMINEIGGLINFDRPAVRIVEWREAGPWGPWMAKHGQIAALGSSQESQERGVDKPGRWPWSKSISIVEIRIREKGGYQEIAKRTLAPDQTNPEGFYEAALSLAKVEQWKAKMKEIYGMYPPKKFNSEVIEESND